MYDATDSHATADEIVAAVQALRTERDDLRRQLDARLEDDETVVVSMEIPGGRDFTFLEDVNVLAVSPGMAPEWQARLLAQVELPTLTTCKACGAPVWSNVSCTMHGSDQEQ